MFNLNLKFIEELHTKEELVNYFKTKGINITNQQIEDLKRQYEQVEVSKNILTTSQLSQVAGGDYILIPHKDQKVRYYLNCKPNDVDLNSLYVFYMMKSCGGRKSVEISIQLLKLAGEGKYLPSKSMVVTKVEKYKDKFGLHIQNSDSKKDGKEYELTSVLTAKCTENFKGQQHQSVSGKAHVSEPTTTTTASTHIPPELGSDQFPETTTTSLAADSAQPPRATITSLAANSAQQFEATTTTTASTVLPPTADHAQHNNSNMGIYMLVTGVALFTSGIIGKICLSLKDDK